MSENVLYVCRAVTVQPLKTKVMETNFQIMSKGVVSHNPFYMADNERYTQGLAVLFRGIEFEARSESDNELMEGGTICAAWPKHRQDQTKDNAMAGLELVELMNGTK